METLSFEFSAGQPPRGRALVGCVGSGDLEVLIEPGLAGKLTIQVQTSVNGEQRWQHLFARMFDGQTPPAMNIDRPSGTSKAELQKMSVLVPLGKVRWPAVTSPVWASHTS